MLENEIGGRWKGMLFFRKHDSVINTPFEMKNWINRQSNRVNKGFNEFYKKIIVTLQVRLPENTAAKSGKRVSFSASASMTVEAALVLPLFLFAGCILMQPFQILNTQRQVQEILEVVAEDISQNAGVAFYGGQISEQMTEAAAWAYAEASVRKKTADLPMQNLSLGQSQLLKDGKTIDLVAHYQIMMPFPVLGLGAVERTNRSFRYAWTGCDGAVDGAGDGQETDEEMVYVGRDSTRYHLSRSCHYLSTELKGISYANLEAYRNKDGTRYKSCDRCGASHGATVYITPYGERYHGDPECSALAAYVREVPKSQVEYLGACSYCGGGK